MLQLEGENYTICGESTEFTSRQKSIFDQLNAVEVKRNVTSDKYDDFGVKANTNPDGVVKRQRVVNTRQYKGKDSIFKKVLNVSPRRKSQIPDHQRNPHKWVKYSLSDVSQDDMSDQSNTAAAMAFLNEIAARKQKQTTQVATEVTDKVIFKKPVQPASGRNKIVNVNDTEEDSTTFFRGSKLVMPEYVIGQQKKGTKRSFKSNANRTEKEIKLNHLTDFDDGDGDDEN